jgi:hypothetical protein
MPSILEEPGPPLSQIIQGSLEEPGGPVRPPWSFSKAQKNSVLLGWFSLFTGTFPAKLRAMGWVTLGSGLVTTSGANVS